MNKINISILTQEEKVELFKDLIDDLNVCINACYGETWDVERDNVRVDRASVWDGPEKDYVFIDTKICTG